MWLSVVWTLMDNDTRHHSGQNVVDSRAAAKWVHNKQTTLDLFFTAISQITGKESL